MAPRSGPGAVPCRNGQRAGTIELAVRGAETLIHPAAIVESDTVGAGTRVWAFTHVLAGASIGRDCNIGGHSYVESGAVIGDRVTVKNGNALWAGVTLEDGVFVGPGVVFTNDRQPRSPRLGVSGERYDGEEWLAPTTVRRGATLAAGAVILPGLTVGEFAFVGAGAVVTRDVAAHALVLGNPARAVGWVCRCARRLDTGADRGRCPDCGFVYADLPAVAEAPGR
jgi:UDP-2-acetamido-3-amino-2,3-dideoxy-glucuronate N-acetyltransferase